jgi:hypothetical protein
MPRVAPDGGYDFSRKRDYRRRVWATFRDGLKSAGVSVADAQAMLMPSLEGDEIEVALNAGFRERNLHVVDMEPAVVATLKRRYPKITTYGISASRAFERMACRGVSIQCANLDFCNNLSQPFWGELSSISLCGSYRGYYKDGMFHPQGHGGVFGDECLVAVSMLRGRERSGMLGEMHDDDMNELERLVEARFGGSLPFNGHMRRHLELIASLPERDRYRLSIVNQALAVAWHSDQQAQRPEVSLCRTETYPSSNGQTMLWSVWRISSYRSVFAYVLKAGLEGRITKEVFGRLRWDIQKDLTRMTETGLRTLGPKRDVSCL